MCDRSNVMLNRESSLSLKLVVTVVIIVGVDIFIGVFNIWVSSHILKLYKCKPKLQLRGNGNDVAYAD